MKKIRVSAKTIQKAIDEGLKSLNATQDEVDIKIIDEGGLFKKATVELTLDKEVEEIRQQIEEKQEEEKRANEKEDKKEPNKEKVDKKEKSNKDASKGIKEEAKDKIDSKQDFSSKDKDSDNSENEVLTITGKDAIEFGTNFLKELFKKMNVEAEVTAVELESGVTFNAFGEKVSILIGKRGETLNAIQDILSNVLKNNGYRETRFYFDVENYKNRREDSLIRLSEKMANKAIKINKPIRLERMNAYERKIIHSNLQNIEGVTTKSEGEEPNRYIVIIPTNENK